MKSDVSTNLEGYSQEKKRNMFGKISRASVSSPEEAWKAEGCASI